MVKNFLTIDNGGTNTKVIVFNQYGQQLAAEAFPTQGLEPQSGFHEIDRKHTIMVRVEKYTKK